MSAPTSDAASSKSIEKGGASVLENPLDSLDQEVVKRAWRKVDWHIMPVAVILYLSSYIDRQDAFANEVSIVLTNCVCRANIGSAKVLGLYAKLHLTDNQYNLALSIFFLGYVIFEVPSNIIVKRIGPSLYIPIMTVSSTLVLVLIRNSTVLQILWGAICALTSLVNTSAGLSAARFFLGLVEAGFLPGIIFWRKSPKLCASSACSLAYSWIVVPSRFARKTLCRPLLDCIGKC